MRTITRKELAGVIGEKTLHISDRDQLVKSIAAYLAGSRTTFDVDSLVRDVMQYRLERGYVEAVAVSAHELSPLVVRDIETLLKDHFPKAKHVKVDSRIDETLVGGIRIELPRENLDLSVRSKLNLFKRLVAEEK